jgi:hypothetical protein
MNIWVRIPILKDFTVERATAQTNIKSEEVSHLSLQKDQVAQVIGKCENWLWAVDDSSNEGWLPKSMSRISTVIVPHLGVDIDFRITLTIKNQVQRFQFEHEFENYYSKDLGIFNQIEWDDPLYLKIEVSHRAISFFKISLNDFREKSQKTFEVELKNFKRTAASITIQVNLNEDQYLEDLPEGEKSEEKTVKLISGEILRYQCNAAGSCGQVYQVGRLIITNYRFLFSSGSVFDFVLTVPHYCIENFLVNLAQITITTKDLRTVDFYISQEYMRYVLDKYAELDGMHFCFDYHLAFNLSSDFGWSIYDPEREFTRMGGYDSGQYLRTDINLDYSFCESYPAVLFQPANVLDDELRAICNFRSRKRVPTITWIGKASALFRSSQPCVGVFYSRCKEDEDFMVKAGIKFIVDCRPKVSARANKVKGKGFEHSAYYSNCKMHFMNIPNIHKIRTSYEALKGITGKEDFLILLHNSKWMNYMKAVLVAAKAVADFLIFQRSSTLVHCSDGWDRTTQISSLSQLLIDPFYRTFHGFQVLICKDWLSFGHKFKDRSSNTSDGSPIFLQFLDAVHQILIQNTKEFQFSNKYLLFLAAAVYSGKYGTFMTDCEKDLRQFCSNTVSVWKEENQEFFNADYSPSTSEVLTIKTHVSSLTFWSYFYLWDSF